MIVSRAVHMLIYFGFLFLPSLFFSMTFVSFLSYFGTKCTKVTQCINTFSSSSCAKMQCFVHSNTVSHIPPFISPSDYSMYTFLYSFSPSVLGPAVD